MHNIRVSSASFKAYRVDSKATIATAVQKITVYVKVSKSKMPDALWSNNAFLDDL